MSVTQLQLRGVARFSFGVITHRIKSYRCAVSLDRTGVGHDVFRKFTYTIETELEGSDLADLKTQLDTAKASLVTSGSDFKIYRAGTIVHQHDAADCHFGPVATITANGTEQAGSRESITLTVECLVPVSAAGGLIDETYEESTIVDDEGDVTSTVRTGKVITTSATSAKGYIEANVPAQPAGYDRTLDIRTDDTDSSATYTLTDAKTDRRNYDANVRDHKYTRTRNWQGSVLESITYSGSVRMVEGQSAGAFIEANLPAATSGFGRSYSITNSDDDRDGSYTVTDTKASWAGLPGIDEAQLEESESEDANGRRIIGRSGFFVGSDAVAQVEAIRVALAVLGVIVSREVRIDIYGDGKITFRFTALGTTDGSGITAWTEAVRKSGGGRQRRVLLYPDRNPFIFNGESQPDVIEVAGRAVSITGAYVAPPAAPSGLEDYQSGQTDYATSRLSDKEFETAWRMIFICPPGTSVPKPRSKVVAFLP